MTNPFSLSFGKEPLSFIERGRQSREIIDGFSEENPSCQVHMITWVRGTGKIVMLTHIVKYFCKEKDWIVVDFLYTYEYTTYKYINLHLEAIR